MPAYNAERYIGEAIDSVLKQDFNDWELLVINDGSTDATVSIVGEFVGRDSRIKLINQTNQRLGAARNTGFRNAIGKWVAFLDADDTWLPEKLNIQYYYIYEKQNIDVFFSNGYTYFEGEKIRLYYHFPVANGLFDGVKMYQIEFSGNQIPVLSVVVKRDWIEKVGFQDEIVKGSEDWDYWLRLAIAGATFYGIDQRLFIYRVHDGGMSAKILTQKLSSITILIKNFQPNLLTKTQVENFKKFFFEVYTKLQKSNRQDEANLLRTSFRSLSFNKSPLVNNLYFEGALYKLNNDNLNLAKIINTIRIKNLFITIIKTLVFPLYKKYSKHSFNINIQYHRWVMGSRLVTKGFFYIHPTAKIISEKVGGKFTAYGISIYDYSRINMSSKGSFLCAKDVLINRYCNFNIWGTVSIGNNVLFNNYCSLNCLNEISIGDNTWFGEGVRLYDHNHQFKDRLQPFTNQGFTTGKISIGNNVWVGSNTVILQNVSIGDNCVIGANNLIYKSIPQNTIVKARGMEIVDSIK
jgi:glycosyltransferase involved in cell wall biosynthesis/carbonic anhydrase/acetyltransferase-like protein (isoleucine patch superfamily)